MAEKITSFLASVFLFVTSSFQVITNSITNTASPTPVVPIVSVSPTISPAISETPTIQPSITKTVEPTATITPTIKPTQTYTHSSNADLGQMGFTVEGGQNSNTCSGGMCYLKVHGPFTITAYVKNFGTGMAANVPYVWYDNDVVIKQGTIGHLAPNVETSISVGFNSATYSGLHNHRFVINPNKTLPEGSMAPNEGKNPWTVEPF